MAKAVRVLLIQRSAAEAEEIAAALRKGAFEPSYRVVTTSEAFHEALAADTWDAILTDFGIEGLSVSLILERLKATALAIPVIVIAQSIGEERVAALIKAGAADYVARGNWIRLPAVIDRELKVTAQRIERRRASEARVSAHASMEREIQKRNEELHKLNCLLRDEVINRRQAEEAQAAISQRLAMTLRASKAGSWDWDIRQDVSIWSDELRELYGIPPDQSVGRLQDRFKLIVPEDQEAVQAAIQRAFKSGIYDVEYRIQHQATGEIHWVYGRGHVFFDELLKPVRMVGILIDITERKQLESNLLTATQRLEAHLANSPMAIVEFAGDFSITRWSPEAEHMFGWDSAEVLGKKTRQLRWVHEDDTEHVDQLGREMQQGRETKWVSINRNYRKDGTVIYCEWYNSAIRDAHGKLLSVFSQVLEVTQRVQATEALRQSEERERIKAQQLQTILESVPGAIFIADDPACLSIRGNTGAIELLHVSGSTNISKTAPEGERPTTWQEMKDGQPLQPEQLPMQRAGRGEVVRDFEMDLVFTDGTVKTVHCNASPLLDAQGNFAGAVAALTDITERKRAEERLRLTEERFRTFVDHSRDGIIIIDEHGTILEWNEGEEQITDIPASEALGRCLCEMQYRMLPTEKRTPGSLDEIKARIQGGLKEGARLQRVWEEEIERPDGSRRTLQSIIFAIPAGEKVLAGAITRDITERKLAEEALMKSEEKYRLLFENTADGFALYELLYDEHGEAFDWRILELNDAYVRHTGLPRELLVGRRISEVFPIAIPDYLPIFADVVANQSPADFETYSKMAGRYMHVATFPAGGHRFASIIQNITQRMQAEEALRTSEERFRSLAENLPSVLMRFDRDLRVAFLSPQAAPITGIPAEAFIGRTNREVGMPTDLCDLWDAALAQVFETGEPHNLEFDMPAADGSVRTFYLKLAPERDSEGVVKEVLGIATEITERTQAEQAVQESQHKVVEILESISDGFFSLDSDWTFNYINRRAAENVGYKPEELLGRNIWENFPEILGTDMESAYRTVMESRTPRQFEYQGVLSSRAYEISVYPSGKSGISVYWVDVTERKRAEAALRESEARYRNVVKYAPAGIYEIDFRTQKFTSVNDAMCQLTSYTREELLSMNPREILDEHGQALFQRRVKQWLAGEKPDENVEYRVKTKDGRELFAVLNATFTSDDQGRPVGATVVGYDVTEQRRVALALYESQQRLQTALSNPKLTVWEQDRELRYVWLHNPTLGFATDGVLGKTDYDLLEPEQADRLTAIKQQVLDTGIGAHEEVELKHDNLSAWFDLTVEPLRDQAGAITGISCVSIELPSEQAKRRTNKDHQSALTQS